MSSYVVWIDSVHAKIFNFTEQGVKHSEIRQHLHDHHTHNKHDVRNEASGKFFHDLATAVNSASELLVVGPGLTKDHFKAHLLDHHHNNLAHKLVGLEPMDHPTDNQIVEFARKYFKRLIKTEKI